ncbi:MAG: tetratricopeptide repeat protein, partial [Candidatus Eremiobacteraeota bacterium]|nr:tetratricopeptide repeat protein [Candidatus Eremiobacteraeota bacterium]
MLVVFEDLQWAGEATSASLEYLARRLRSTPALLLATYRDEEDAITRTVQPLRRKLQLENVAHHISLGGLSIEAVCDLARNVPVLAPSADAVGLRAHAVSGGNPLFAAELLRESAESGIHDVSSRFLQAIIESRTARISETARKVAHAASVIGATFDSEVLRDVTALPEHAVSEGIAELVARNFVRQIGSVNFAFAFAHELIASTIYERIDASNRIEWHRRVAEAIERISTSGDDAAGQVAYHYEKGAAPEEAARFYLAAAQRSFDVFANADALAMATRGLELTRDPERRQQLLGLRERILGRLGERDAQAADIEALEELANDDDSRLDVLWRRAQLAHARGELVDEARYLRSLEGPSTHSAVHALARRAWSRNLMLRSEYVEAAHIAEKALENARNAGDVAAEVDSLCLLAELAVNQGEASRAQDFLAQAELHAARASDLVLMARVAMASAAVAIMRREFARALTHAQEAQRRYRDIGDRDGEAEATARVGAALSFLMRFDDAAQEFSTAAAIYRALGNRLQLAYLAFNETGTQMQRGLLSEARASLLNALDIFKDLGDARGRAVCLTNLSMVRLLQQAATEAKGLGVDALHAARQIANAAIEAAALSNLGNAERELGELDAALGHMHEAIAIRKRLGRSATFEELADLALAQLKAGQGAARETAD